MFSVIDPRHTHTQRLPLITPNEWTKEHFHRTMYRTIKKRLIDQITFAALLRFSQSRKDPNLNFNETKYGSLMSAISFPNLFMPFFGGLFLDSNGHKQGILLFLGIQLVGEGSLHLFTFILCTNACRPLSVLYTDHVTLLVGMCVYGAWGKGMMEVTAGWFMPRVRTEWLFGGVFLFFEPL